MRIEKNFDLSALTSFGTGGTADSFAVVETTEELTDVLASCQRPIWLIGSGANMLVSDTGLRGTVIQLALAGIEEADGLIVAGAGASWDDLVRFSLEVGSWGLEMMSGIPGSVGAAISGNIAAYGQAAKDTLAWVEVIDYEQDNPKPQKIPAEDISFEYRNSSFNGSRSGQIITRVAYFRSGHPTHEVKYESAKKVFNELGLNVDDLNHRREAIMEARRRAGSLLDANNTQKTAGSFFKNPSVSAEQVAKIIEFEEKQDISGEQVLKQNQVHGGEARRVSAAHVLLAAGFSRGQAWGPVRLHPDHVLKIENTGEATSQQIYDVAMNIVQTVKQKLDVDLEPEVKFLGDFTT